MKIIAFTTVAWHWLHALKLKHPVDISLSVVEFFSFVSFEKHSNLYTLSLKLKLNNFAIIHKSACWGALKVTDHITIQSYETNYVKFQVFRRKLLANIQHSFCSGWYFTHLLQHYDWEWKNNSIIQTWLWYISILWRILITRVGGMVYHFETNVNGVWQTKHESQCKTFWLIQMKQFQQIMPHETLILSKNCITIITVCTGSVMHTFNHTTNHWHSLRRWYHWKSRTLTMSQTYNMV